MLSQVDNAFHFRILSTLRMSFVQYFFMMSFTRSQYFIFQVYIFVENNSVLNFLEITVTTDQTRITDLIACLYLNLIYFLHLLYTSII